MTSSAPVLTAPAMSGSRLLLRFGAGLVVLGLLALVTVSLPALDQVQERLAGASTGWLAVAFGLELASCAAFIVAYRSVFAGRMSWRRSYDVGMAVQGTNVLAPAGGASGLAVGAWALGRLGRSSEALASRSVAFFVLTSAVNFITAIVAGVGLALGLLPADVPLELALVPAGLAFLVLAVTVAVGRRASERPAPSSRVRLKLDAVREVLRQGVQESGRIVASGAGAALGGAVGYMVFDLATLASAFAALGTVPPIGVLALAYVLGQLGGLIPLPGGIGGADGGVVAALVLYGVPLPEAAAAVLAYRLFQLGLPATLGAVALLRLPRVVAAA